MSSLETQPLLSTSSPSTQLDHQESVVNDSNHEFTSEIKILFKYATPLVGTFLLQYFYALIVVIVSARLSTDELAGVSLAITTSNIIGYAIFEGMATSLDTLCAQAYGSGRVTHVGLHAIRFTIFIHLVAVPIGITWLFSPQILVHIVPHVHLAATAGEFLRYSLIGVPGYATFEAGKRFMQAQGNFTAGLLVLIACVPINLTINWFFVVHLSLRVKGAAISAALTHLVRPILLLLYAMFLDRSTLQCWPDSSLRKASILFRNWKPMVSLSISGALMTLSEWFAFEILTFSTTYVSTAQLAAQTFLYNSSILIWHIPFSASVATSTRIGQLIGGGFITTARNVAHWYAIVFVILGIVDMGLLVGVSSFLTHGGAILDNQVSALVATAMPFVALFQFFDASSSWIHGVIRGLGWQSIGAWIVLIVNYAFAVPLALGLELGAPKMGIKGIWIALAVGLAIITVLEAAIVERRDWQLAVVEEAPEQDELGDERVDAY